jgi:hypothetical protein
MTAHGSLDPISKKSILDGLMTIIFIGGRSLVMANG